jgi:hypothetical protein
MKKLLLTASAITLLGAALATSASAYVYCNANGECWHSDADGHYDANLGITVHPDDWYFHQHWDADHHWRDYHDGRGYYRNGLWIALP